jgi:cellobiose PTS system EIIC component
MKKFIHWLEFSLSPKMQKFVSRPWIAGFSAAVLKCLPFVLTGCLVYLYNVPRAFFPALPDLSVLANYTFGMLSLLVAFMMVYQLMGYLKHKNYQIVGGLTGICSYLLVMKGKTVDGVFSVTWNRFGPTGLVVSMVVGLFVAFVFNSIAKLHLFKGNDVVPEFVQEWIKNMIPIIICIIFFKFIIIDFNCDLYPIVLKAFAPVAKIAETFPGYLLITLFPVFMYSLGISGWTWAGVRQAIFIPAMAANVAAVAAGGVATNIVTSETCSGIALIVLGGMGCTLSLNLLMLRSRSKRIRTLGKVCLAPSIFNINEPILFGMPMVYNVILMMPMWICTIVGCAITWIIFKTGLLNIPFVQLAMIGQIPAPVSTVMLTKDWRGVIWWAVLLVIYMLIYMPFFKVYERQELAKEAEEAEKKGTSLTEAAE